MIFVIAAAMLAGMAVLFSWLGYEAGKCQGWIDCEANYKPVLDRWRDQCLGRGGRP